MYQRALRKIIEKNLFQGKIIILYGARQVGKTTLVKNIIEKSARKAKYIDCDLLDNRQSLQVQDPDKLKKFLGDYDLIIMDEAQRVLNIGLSLKILHDHYPEMQIVATGSSSFDLANKINEPLTGRAFDYMLFPLSIEEIHQKYDYAEIKRKLESMLQYGLYPAVFDMAEEETIKMLQVISSNYLYKDILEFENIKKSDQLIDILQLLALQVGQEISYHELGTQLGLNTVTMQKYIHLLEKTFIIFRLRGFSRNLRKEIRKSVKIYFWDLGIRNSLIKNFNKLSLRSDVGALWENFCISERMKFNHNNQHFVNSYFWRTYDQKEIDYLEEEGEKLTSFEFKWNPNKKNKAPKEFLKTYKNSSFTVINQENFDQFLFPKINK